MARPLITAALLTLFGFFLHQNRPIALASLTAALILMTAWLWKTSYNEARQTLGLRAARVGPTLGAGALGLATAALLRWSQSRAVHPLPLRPFALVAVAIGLTEELIFRGYLLGRIAQHHRPATAIALSALFHATYKTALFATTFPAADLAFLGGLTLAFGLLLGHWRVKTNSIWPPAAFHILVDLWVYGDRAPPWWVW